MPAKLAARARLLGSSSARKTDVADANSVAAVARHNPRLNRVRLESDTTIMRLLTERRDDLVAEHTRWINRLQVLLRDLRPGGAGVPLDTTRAAALLPKPAAGDSPGNVVAAALASRGSTGWGCR